MREAVPTLLPYAVTACRGDLNFTWGTTERHEIKKELGPFLTLLLRNSKFCLFFDMHLCIQAFNILQFSVVADIHYRTAM